MLEQTGFQYIIIIIISIILVCTYPYNRYIVKSVQNVNDSRRMHQYFTRRIFLSYIICNN